MVLTRSMNKFVSEMFKFREKKKGNENKIILALKVKNTVQAYGCIL